MNEKEKNGTEKSCTNCTCETGEEVKQYDTGATRGGGKKPSHMAYNSPLSDICFGEYMMGHETQSDGKQREPGNWKLGMPIDDYAEALERHVIDLRMIRDGFTARDNATLKDTLCAIRFNVNGYLHELISAELKEEVTSNDTKTCDNCYWFADENNASSLAPCYDCRTNFNKWKAK